MSDLFLPPQGILAPMQRQIVAVPRPSLPDVQEPASYGPALEPLLGRALFAPSATYRAEQVRQALHKFAREIGPLLPPDQQDIVDYLWFQAEGWRDAHTG